MKKKQFDFLLLRDFDFLIIRVFDWVDSAKIIGILSIWVGVGLFSTAALLIARSAQTNMNWRTTQHILVHCI